MTNRTVNVRSLVPATSVFLAAFTLAACGTNPVTGKTELQFISTTSEIRMGEQAYFPTRQVQGGDYLVHPSVTRYVQGVNSRLAAVSDRDLPFEIEVLNSSVPNAWAMPGGKMAINRGLLVHLQSEAELAAVLGHEIVHAAARHGAKSQERGMLLQGGLLAAQVAAAGSDYRNLIAGGTMLGAQLVTTRYGRDAELESDLYGMEYMVKAGYDPNAAIDLQQTFVQLSEGRQSSWLEGLFASHPPSQERVARNRETAARLGGADLKYGRESYREAIAPLLADQAAYDAHDEAMKAVSKKDYKTANTLVDKALKLQPKEARFHGLKGDLAFVAKQYPNANRHYERAINLYPDYFAFHLQKGLALRELGNAKGAEASLRRSNELVPTPIAQKILGDLALLGGDKAVATKYYQSAAASGSGAGKDAQASLARLELEEKPGKYIATRIAQDRQGRIVVAVQNRSPVAVRNVEVVVAYFDQAGRQTSDVQRYNFRKSLKPGEEGTVTTNLTEGRGLRSSVSRAIIVK